MNRKDLINRLVARKMSDRSTAAFCVCLAARALCFAGKPLCFSSKNGTKPAPRNG
jgi:hypothetical protein